MHHRFRRWRACFRERSEVSIRVYDLMDMDIHDEICLFGYRDAVMIPRYKSLKD